METRAVHRYLDSFSLWTASIAALVALAGLSLVAAPASARRIGVVGRDGKIRGCYRVKGKPKGMLRVVRARHYHCMRGERKVAWSAAMTSGQSAPQGQAGAAGQAGQGGKPGASGTSTGKEALLESKVAALTLEVESLKGLLEGVDNKGLREAVASVPLLDEVCAQTEALTGVTNEFGTEFQKLLTTLTGSLLGAIFDGVTVPGALDETLTCPS